MNLPLIVLIQKEEERTLKTKMVLNPKKTRLPMTLSVNYIEFSKKINNLNVYKEQAGDGMCTVKFHLRRPLREILQII
jgi:hypothetical protein